MSARVLLSWSGGKDSALALYEMSRGRKYKVTALLTTLTQDFGRISMHGVRRSLLDAQASSLGLPVEEVWIPKGASNEIYEARMNIALANHKTKGIERVAFGDLFLQDIRSYRETRLAELGMKGIFPLWGKDTTKLAREFIEIGFRAIICCVDPKKLSREFCGREYDEAFLESIPATVDPCGENGEFHTFVYAGPIFSREIPLTKGRVVLRDGFYFADLIPRG
jgi:uncharacterized protein (TIGR00290 family)